MKHLLFRPYLLFIFLFALNFSACGPPATGPVADPETGNRATDNSEIPDQGNGGKSHSYSASANLINPNHFNFFQDFQRYRELPFNPAFLSQNGIQRISISHYKNDDNNFAEGLADEQLVLSGSRVLEFDGEGKIRVLETERLANGKPWIKLAIRFDYNAAGQLIKALVRDVAFEDVNESQISYVYKSDGRIVERNDPSGKSFYFSYDEVKQHRYRLEVDPSGRAVVHVSGKHGDFPDSTCIAIQDEILTLGSKFVPYTKAPGLVSDVIFFEREARRIVRQVNMGTNGSIDYTVDHLYNTFDNLNRQAMLWDDAEAIFRSEKVFRYTPANDLSEILFKNVRNNAENSTEIWRFGYSPEGQWNRFSKHKRVESGPEETLEINLIKMENANSFTKPQPHGAPGGTH